MLLLLGFVLLIVELFVELLLGVVEFKLLPFVLLLTPVLLIVEFKLVILFPVEFVILSVKFVLRFVLLQPIRLKQSLLFEVKLSAGRNIVYCRLFLRFY